MSDKINCKINGVTECSIRKVTLSWFILRIGEHSFLVHFHDIVFRRTLLPNKYYVETTLSALLRLPIPSNVRIFNFEHFSNTGGNSVKFIFGNNESILYVPIMYFKPMKFVTAKTIRGSIEIRVGKTDEPGLTNGIYLVIPRNQYDKI